MRRPSPAVAFAMLLFASLLAVIYWTGARALADIMALESRYQIARWRSGKLILDNRQRDAIRSELFEALELDAGSPALLDDLARFHAARGEGGQSHGLEALQLRQQSLGFYRQLLLRQPTSGHAWANLALTKFRLGEIDLEFSRALRQALRRGPWDPKLQLMVIELGLASWQAQSADTQQVLKQAIQTQSRWQQVNQKTVIQALLKRYRRPELVCLLAAAVPASCAAS